jgi:hypothetical protein
MKRAKGAERGPVVSVTRIKGLQVNAVVRPGKPDYVNVTIEAADADGEASDAQRGGIFLGVALGAISWDGTDRFTELDGVIRPRQLDELIDALTLARAKATELEIVPA